MTEKKALTRKASPNIAASYADARVPMAESFVGSALQYLGGLTAIDRLKEHLSSQVIEALMTIEEQKLFEHYGYTSFKEFLEGAELSNVSKSGYYRLRELFLKEGPEQYDLFTSWKVPLKTRRLLSSGDVVIDGDEVVIGGEERISLANSRGVKKLVEQLVKDKIKAVQDVLDTDAKLERSEAAVDRLKKVEAEYEEWRAAYAHGTPYEQAYLGLMKAFVIMVAEVKEMGDEERLERAEPDTATFAEQWRQLTEAFSHGNRILQAKAATATGTPAPFFQSDAIDEDNF